MDETERTGRPCVRGVWLARLVSSAVKLHFSKIYREQGSLTELFPQLHSRTKESHRVQILNSCLCPVCVLPASPLSNNDSLLERRIRSGDTLSVSYHCEEDCQLIREIILWIRQVVTAIQCENGIEDYEIHTDSVIWSGISSNYHETLPIHIFDWLSPKAFVNKLYFETGHGESAMDLSGQTLTTFTTQNQIDSGTGHF